MSRVDITHPFRRVLVGLLIATAVIATAVIAATGWSAAAASAISQPTLAPKLTVTSTATIGQNGAKSATGTLPLGAPVAIDRFEYSLGPVEWDQTERVVTAAAAPPAIPEGYGWALIRLTITNRFNDPATPGRFTIVLHAAGWDVPHTKVYGSPTPMPDSFDPLELAGGESVAGNLGFWIPDLASSDPDCYIELIAWEQDALAQRFSCKR